MKKAKEYWPSACAHLRACDPVMAQLIDQFASRPFVSRSSAFVVLCRAIVGQQISVKAADAIWSRLTKTLQPLTPETMKKCRKDRLGRCGLSQSKVHYLKNVADFFMTQRIGSAYWKQDYPAVRESLLAIKGVGEWTFEMFAIFYLNYPDVLPLTDLGLVNAVSRLYHQGGKLSREEVIKISMPWMPWRTVATWYLWRSIDAEIIVY